MDIFLKKEVREPLGGLVVEGQTLNFVPGHDPRVVGSSPASGSAQSVELA